MQDMQENNNDDDSMPLTKTKTKKSEEKPNLKKVRSDKQIAAFNKTMEIRKQKVEERKNQKLLESAKILVEKHGKKDDQQPKNNKITPFQKYAESS
jgi:predicted metal-dependent hydrolase